MVESLVFAYGNTITPGVFLQRTCKGHRFLSPARQLSVELNLVPHGLFFALPFVLFCLLIFLLVCPFSSLLLEVIELVAGR